ncbi:MAG: Uma2 family endonuclease [Acidobacteriota bacterium]
MVQELKVASSKNLPTVVSPLKMTYEEFLQWADDKQHVEWVNGEVVFMGTVSSLHQIIGSFLIALFRIWVETKNLGEIRYDPFNMKTAPHLNGRSPDILFVAKENLARLKKNYLEGPADLVVEIISPESRVRDRGEKFYEYEEGGVREYWLIDPMRKKAEFYCLGEDKTYEAITPDETGVYHSRTLAGLTLKVDWLWQESLPPILDVVKTWGLI